jgi:hypothetical protein
MGLGRGGGAACGGRSCPVGLVLVLGGGAGLGGGRAGLGGGRAGLGGGGAGLGGRGAGSGGSSSSFAFGSTRKDPGTLIAGLAAIRS